ncbi:hypothetical protein ACFOWA_11730 [Pedobacter lithocola]|uniref:Copper amine oxidase N-terminal domain-containing protein n=1 Tax=Pedobacter lithocola TaxID=1908239 RepID=A0ABV8PCL0_9SPHI
MKKTIFTILLFAIANFTFSQQKYYAFSINGKHGITDTLGSEVIKPIYKYRVIIPAKNQIYLQDFSEKRDIIFNAKTGKKDLYESVYNNWVEIKNVPYSVIRVKDRKFLLSEETDKTIPFSRDYDEFYNVGNYIIASYYAQEPYSPGSKDKNGKLLPPHVRELKKHYAVLANDESLKTIVDKGFDKYLPLYKRPDEAKEEGIATVVTVTLKQINVNPNFDYIVLSQGNNHKLYNDKMVLVKAFVLQKADTEMLVAFCRKTLKVNLNDTPENGYGPTFSAPPMDGRISKKASEDLVEKKPFVSYFYIKKLENGNTIFALKEISKRIFEANSKMEVRLFEKKNLITISIDGEELSEFNYNPKTGEIYLPKAYFSELGLTIL